MNFETYGYLSITVFKINTKLNEPDEVFFQLHIGSTAFYRTSDYINSKVINQQENLQDPSFLNKCIKFVNILSTSK